MMCDFDERRACRKCGHVYPERFSPPVIRTCRGRPGLGDRLAGFLARLGIRKRPGCGCEERQAWLNRLGARVAGWFRGKAGD